MKHYKTNNECKSLTVITHSPEETENLGRVFARCLHPGASVGLIGELASGKTCFIQGIVKELCGDYWVHSPTFTIMNQYGRSPTILHLDCYRISDEREIIDIGYEEFINENTICLIEWADRIQNLILSDTILIYFEHININSREIKFFFPDDSTLLEIKKQITLPR